MASVPLSVRIVLLGDVRFEVGTERTTFPHREHVRRLLVRLVLHPRQPYGRKQLAFTLWPDAEPAAALANLRRHLYLLRAMLPPAARSWLIVSTQEIVWNAPLDCNLDVAAFEQEWTTVAEMEAAAALYGGELAPGVDNDDEILSRRAALHRRYLLLLKTLAHHWVERGDWQRAAVRARQLLALDPWDEEAVRWLMIAAVQIGQRATALDLYRALVAELQRELDAQPSPETTALYHDILHHRLAPPTPSRPSLAPPLFIGRDEQLRQLFEFMHHAGQGQGLIVFVSGPAGVGKTTLVQEAIYRGVATVSAWHVLRGYCQPARRIGEQQAYVPWRQVLTAAAARLVQAAPNADWLARLLPLAPELALLRPHLITPDQPDAAALRLAIRQAIQTLAAAQPLLLLIEDSHWLDQASLEVLSEVVAGCRSLPLLIIATHRSGAITPAFLALKQRLRRQQCAYDVTVPSFTREETDRFLSQTLDQQSLGAATLADIRQYAGGLPLLLREAVAAVRDMSTVTKHSLSGLPDLLRLRLRALNEHNRQMLEAAAILGFSCADAVLQRMLAWSPATYASALDELSARHLLVDTVMHGADDYAFSHHLIHELVVSDIPADRALALHEQAARALTTVYAGQSGYAARIAYHFEHAGHRLQAARYWLDHSRESTDLAAFGQALEAIAHTEALLAGASRTERELQTQATLQRGVVALYQGDAATALALLEQAVMASREFPALYVQALVMQAYALYTRDRASDAYAAATQALALATSLNDTVNLVRAHNIRGVSALMLGQVEGAIADLRQACASLEQIRPDEHGSGVIAQTAQSLNHLGTALVFAQEYRQAREVLDQTVAIAQRSGLRRLEAAALTMIGQMLLNCGRYDEAERVYTRSLEVAGDAYKPGMWGKYAGRGWVYLRVGDHEAARRDFMHGWQIATQVQSQYGVLLMQSYLTFVDLAQGRNPAWSFAQVAAQAEAAQYHPVVYIASLLAGQLWEWLDQTELALAMYEQAGRAAQASHVPSFVVTARLRYLGRRMAIAPGSDLWAELDALGAQAVQAGELPAQALAALARANAWLASGQAAQAALAAEQAVMLARACPDVPLLGESLLALSDSWLQLGEVTRAQVALAEAQNIARQFVAPLAIPLGLAEAGQLREACLRSLQARVPERAVAPRKRQARS